MLVTFQTKAWGDITMFGDIAVELLELMGHSGAVPGAMLPGDIPAALRRLKKALAERAAEAEDDPDEDEEAESFYDEPVSLRNRALPLIELFTAAAAEDAPVMWVSKGSNRDSS